MTLGIIWTNWSVVIKSPIVKRRTLKIVITRCNVGREEETLFSNSTYFPPLSLFLFLSFFHRAATSVDDNDDDDKSASAGPLVPIVVRCEKNVSGIAGRGTLRAYIHKVWDSRLCVQGATNGFC